MLNNNILFWYYNTVYTHMHNTIFCKANLAYLFPSQLKKSVNTKCKVSISKACDNYVTSTMKADTGNLIQ